MPTSLFREEILPAARLFALLVALGMVAHAFLHQYDLRWVEWPLGAVGTLLIVFSFAYSLRKRKIVRAGSPKLYLRCHEVFSWVGFLLILVHVGFHFNAVLPWLTQLSMFVAVISGVVGKSILAKSLKRHSAQKAALLQQRLSEEEVKEELFWDAVAIDVMKKWRTVHFPITVTFVTLTTYHILSVLMLW